MIGKLLLIRESGVLPFKINQDDYQIDDDLLSGFCLANYQIAKELSDSIDILLMRNNFKIHFQEFQLNESVKFIMAAFCNKYHIDEGVKLKMESIFNTFFRNYNFPKDFLAIKDEELTKNVLDSLNEKYLSEIVSKNLVFIKSVIDPIVKNKENEINAYALTSSTNQILYCYCNEEFLKMRNEEESLRSVIEEYLTIWNLQVIPRGDIFHGVELIAGLDLVDFVKSNQKTYGLCINTCINHKNEPWNEILLYFFGKNILMRQCIIDLEEILRENLV
ncbi:MAG: hypothetical protein ACTSRZ_18710 [Promethearchaeota archaeon]